MDLIRENWQNFLWDSFADGESQRELRLSPKELELLLGCYPKSTALSTSETQKDGRAWYLVEIPKVRTPQN